jgi:hypothetical protein
MESDTGLLDVVPLLNVRDLHGSPLILAPGSASLDPAQHSRGSESVVLVRIEPDG